MKNGEQTINDIKLYTHSRKVVFEDWQKQLVHRIFEDSVSI
jgi:hypothetical protein